MSFFQTIEIRGLTTRVQKLLCLLSVRRHSHMSGENLETDTLIVGVALKEQLVPAGEKIPVNDDDWTLDALILGDGSMLHRKGEP